MMRASITAGERPLLVEHNKENQKTYQQMRQFGTVDGHIVLTPNTAIIFNTISELITVVQGKRFIF
jgi:hypothetical protein